MKDSFKYLDDAALQDILEQNQRNLAFLELQAAKSGPLGITLALANQIDELIMTIELINNELSERGFGVTREWRKAAFGYSSETAKQYTSKFSFPTEEVSAAFEAIQRISNPACWKDFAITRDLSIDGWMGCDSDTLINTLYHIFIPTVIFKLYSKLIYRNFVFLDWKTRFQFLTLEAVADSYLSDDIIADIEPRIDYTPRVPGWRQKRQQTPHTFWWQGLSEDRIENAIGEFLKDDEGYVSIVSRIDFQTKYRRIYNGNKSQSQQNIGLAANALYGFCPQDRPVYWRLLIIQAILYQAITRSKDNSISQPNSKEELLELFRPSLTPEFPFVIDYSPFDCFEEFSVTLNAASEYIRDLAIPKIYRRIRRLTENLET